MTWIRVLEVISATLCICFLRKFGFPFYRLNDPRAIVFWNDAPICIKGLLLTHLVIYCRV